MNNFFPYEIRHIHLDSMDEVPVPDSSRSGYYFVFWWKDIPLGDLYVEPGRRLDAKEFLNDIFRVIEPAIKHYNARLSNPLPENGLFHDPGTLKEKANIILSQQSNMDIPLSVDISVIICTRNRASYVRRCLESLSKLSSSPKEIIVMDNAPADDSTRVVVSEFRSVLYHHEPRPGLDIARNAGARKASSSIIAYVDDDVIIHPGWSFHVWHSFKEPATAAMTGLVIASELQTEAQCLFEKFWSFNRGYIGKVYDQGYFKKTLGVGPPVWDIGAGANMAFRKSVFEEVGYFDERLDVGAAGCNGDSEMWFRLLSKGYQVAYNPGAVVYHEHRKEMKGLKKQLHYYMRGFTAAAMIQQQQSRQAGYRRHLFRRMPKWYFSIIVKEFPYYRSRYKTIFSEISGFISGLLFYIKYRKKRAY